MISDAATTQSILARSGGGVEDTDKSIEARVDLRGGELAEIDLSE
jgi:hypothetical protein